MKITKHRLLYGLEDDEGNTILETEYHAVFQISRELYGHRKGVHFGIIKKTGEEVIPSILQGYREIEDFTTEYILYLHDNPPIMDIKKPLTYKFDGMHYMKEFRGEFKEDNYDRMDLEEGEPYVRAKDYKGDTFLCDFSGKILSYEQFDEIMPLDFEDLFLVFQNDYGNIWNCRNGEFYLKEYLHRNQFSEDVKGRLIIEMENKHLAFNLETRKLEFLDNYLVNVNRTFN